MNYKRLPGTGKSLSEALIFASTNPQYDDRLFIELQVQYMEIPSSNLGRICCVQKLFCKKKSFWQRFTCTKVLRKLGGRHMSSLLGSPPTRWSLLTQFMCLVRAKWCINICRSDFNCHPTRVPNVYHMGSQNCDTFIWPDRLVRYVKRFVLKADSNVSKSYMNFTKSLRYKWVFFQMLTYLLFTLSPFPVIKTESHSVQFFTRKTLFSS